MYTATNRLKTYKYDFLTLNLVSHFDTNTSSFIGKKEGMKNNQRRGKFKL